MSRLELAVELVPKCGLETYQIAEQIRKAVLMLDHAAKPTTFASME